MLFSFVIPTRNRHAELIRTLDALGRLPRLDAELIVVDNASTPRVSCPPRLGSGLPVRTLHASFNEGAAGRNRGARIAAGEWLVMLDDDSFPLDDGFVDVLASAPADIGAVGADILLPDGRREAGGLPEVTVGCGMAVRRQAFLDIGGYDAAFGYYAEEYDLCARLLVAGFGVVQDQRFRVRHLKVTTRRDMDLILRRLVRNNGWVMQRYTPASRRMRAVAEVIERYGRIAVKEAASRGYAAGVDELLTSIGSQPRREMTDAVFDRFIGLEHVRATLRDTPAAGTVAIVDKGKNAAVIHAGLLEAGVRIVEDPEEADVLAIGTLSPGPMWDAWERRTANGEPTLPPWIGSQRHALTPT